MTVRAFWTGFFTYIAFFGIMILCAFTFGRATAMSAEEYSEEELFRLEISTLDAMDEVPYFALMPQTEFEDFRDMMERGQPNLVVRVKIGKRSACQVYDPLGYYGNVHLNSNYPVGEWKQAQLYISTPYDVKIEEIILGDPERFEIGDRFTFYAPYGIMEAEKMGVRYEDTPFFSPDGEYYLFLSVLDVDGVGTWYDLTHPSSVCRVMPEDRNTLITETDAGSRIFAGSDFDTGRMNDLIEAIYNENPYALDVPSLAPMAPYSKDSEFYNPAPGFPTN